MITKTKAYTSSDGQVHATLAAAQRCELLALFPDDTAWTSAGIVNTIFANADKIKDVLTTGTKSRPAARAINGAARKSKKPVAKTVGVPHERVAEHYKKMRAAVDADARPQEPVTA